MTELQTDTYLDAVATALADLDAPDRDDLLEDLQLHLAELRVEDPDVDLVARLGSPSSYAEELRQSAGLPGPTSGASFGQRIVALRDAVQHTASRRPWVRSALDFLPQLRPAWWVIRSYGVIALIDKTQHHRGYRWGTGLVPQAHGSHAVGLVVLVCLVVGSVRLATRPPSWRRWGLVALVANAVLAVATPGYFVAMAQDRSHSSVEYVSPCCGQLYGDDGRVITNLYGYDERGQLVPQLQLFDQDGNPVTMPSDNVEGVPSQTNVYPHPQYLEDGTVGRPTPPPFGGPVVVTPTATPLPTPGATPAATAKATPIR